MRWSQQVTQRRVRSPRSRSRRPVAQQQQCQPVRQVAPRRQCARSHPRRRAPPHLRPSSRAWRGPCPPRGFLLPSSRRSRPRPRLASTYCFLHVASLARVRTWTTHSCNAQGLSLARRTCYLGCARYGTARCRNLISQRKNGLVSMVKPQACAAAEARAGFSTFSRRGSPPWIPDACPSSIATAGWNGWEAVATDGTDDTYTYLGRNHTRHVARHTARFFPARALQPRTQARGYWYCQ